MPSSFNCIGLIGKYGDSSAGGMLKTVSDYIQQRHLQVMLDEDTAKLMPNHGLQAAARSVIGEHCDLAIVVGGDGTLLNAARSLVSYRIPLLGINLGRLGFLADISPIDMHQKLNEILDGDYLAEERILLHTLIERDGEQISESDALNDVAVHKWNVARMIECDTYVNGQFVNTYRSDGIVVSTPTGSTAYALSGGGPILHPALNAMVLVPICPHTMNNRPIVFSGDSRIEIKVKDSNFSSAQVTCDGQINLNLVSGDLIKIYKKEKRIRLIHPTSHDHYHILRAKLHWGEGGVTKT